MDVLLVPNQEFTSKPLHIQNFERLHCLRNYHNINVLYFEDNDKLGRYRDALLKKSNLPTRQGKV